jgi:uncharacterized OB-fold protein
MALADDNTIATPMSNRDYEFFYEGLREGRLLVQQCNGCKAVRHPPGPMCPHCHSLSWQALECSGRGTIYSYTVHYHPPLPGFTMPHIIVLGAMEEGFRLVGGMAGAEPDQIAIDQPITIEFVTSGEVASYQFRLA